MNLLALPAVVSLMLLLTACIPRRLVGGDDIVRVAGAVVLVSAAIGAISGLVAGLAALLMATVGVQTVSLAETVRGSELNYRKEGRVTRVGSALLHLGIVILFLDLVAVSKASPYHLPVFWASTSAFMAGSLLSFFPGLGKTLGRLVGGLSG